MQAEAIGWIIWAVRDLEATEIVLYMVCTPRGPAIDDEQVLGWSLKRLLGCRFLDGRIALDGGHANWKGR